MSDSNNMWPFQEISAEEGLDINEIFGTGTSSGAAAPEANPFQVPQQAVPAPEAATPRVEQPPTSPAAPQAEQPPAPQRSQPQSLYPAIRWKQLSRQRPWRTQKPVSLKRSLSFAIRAQRRSLKILP